MTDLQAAGFDVGSARDLVNTAQPYKKAVPILLKHLDKPYPGRGREGIARALAVPEAKSGWGVIMHADQNAEEKDVKDGLAVASGHCRGGRRRMQ